MKEHIKSAIKGLWINRYSVLIATVSIGICFFTITCFFALLYNLENFTKKLTTKASIVIYLKSDTKTDEISSLMNELKKMQSFSSLRYISKEDALKEMKDIIDPELIKLIGYNPLSDTIEAFIKDESLQDIDRIVDKIKSFQSVEEIYYPTNVIVGLKMIRTVLLNLFGAIFFLLSIAILFIIYAIVQSFYWKKTEEIEVLKLLGATPSYIRFPFLIEGGLIGFVGAIWALIASLGVYFVFHLKNISFFLPSISQLEFPTEIFYVLPILGIFLGMLSSFIAIGRIKYQ